MSLLDRLLGRQQEPEPAPPAPHDAAANLAQREAEALRETAKSLEINPRDAKYW